jgi:hypothetical protein
MTKHRPARPSRLIVALYVAGALAAALVAVVARMEMMK